MSSSRRPPLELEGAGGGTSSFEVNSVLCLGAARSSRIGRSSRSSSVPPLRLVSSLYGNFEAGDSPPVSVPSNPCANLHLSEYGSP
eukprot:1401019-Amphidinium_carterae.1